jgi:recombination protein RecA
MPAASAIRLQIESALASRIPAALSPAQRIVRPVASTGIDALDEVVRGGLPVGALTELVGPECSGRTSVALNFVAGLTQAGRVCAWIDVSNALDPASAAAAGVDLERLLWVRCGAAKPAASCAPQRFSLPEKYRTPAPAMKGLHGGGCGGHPRGEVKGLSAAVSGLLRPEAPNLTPRCAEPQPRGTAIHNVPSLSEQPVYRPALKQPVCKPALKQPVCKPALKQPVCKPALKQPVYRPALKQPVYRPVLKQPVYRPVLKGHDFSRADQSNKMNGALAPEGRSFGAFGAREHTKHTGIWAQLDQALRATDLVLQGGGFSAVVLDLGSLAPEFASRVPLATWFRYRAAAEKTQACFLLLAQYGCAKSSAELSLRLEPGEALRDEATVFTGMAHSVEVVRRRFTGAAENVVPLRKPPIRAEGRANAASWQSRAAWAAVR